MRASKYDVLWELWKSMAVLNIMYSMNVIAWNENKLEKLEVRQNRVARMGHGMEHLHREAGKGNTENPTMANTPIKKKKKDEDTTGRRQIPNIPMVTINGSLIPFKSNHKFLGLLLDSPCLTWGCHIQYLDVIQNSALRISLGAFKSSPVCALQAEASLPFLSHRRSIFLVWTYTKLASSPRCHALHSLLLQHSREPLHGPLPDQAHTPFVDIALSFFAILRVTPPPFFILEKNSPLGPWYPLSSSVSLACPVQSRTLFTSLLHSQYHTHFQTYTDGSSLTNPPSVGAAIYIPSRSLATAWRLPATASITTAELFAIKEGLQFATTLAQ
ncbi:hypothetical protein E2C01_029968 [Portunus trituberculatus]|uniref:RNase H type-1 domain-containing protein n=1 Tax=Portunus trituberculatus TaxID=210409 RepID=A0A5B7ETV5_PORTR|nr:hypothetical protein [Portunus trituberculatus]